MWVYVIRNIVNGKCYVGQTAVSVGNRWRSHCSTKSSSPVARAIRKYGRQCFSVEVIPVAGGIDELNTAETNKIVELGSLVPNGYNLSTGGGNRRVHETTKALLRAANIGKKLPDEVRRKISAAHIGKKYKKYSPETCAMLSQQRRGRPRAPHTEDTKAKIGLGNRGKSISAEHRARVAESSRGRVKSQETIAKWRVANSHPRGKYRPSDKMKWSPERKAAASARLSGVPLTEEHRLKLRAAWVIRKARQTGAGA